MVISWSRRRAEQILSIGVVRWLTWSLIQATSIKDLTRDQLRTISHTHTYPDAKVIVDLKKRKLVAMKKRTSFKIDKGPKFALEVVREETDLTADMIARLVIE